MTVDLPTSLTRRADSVDPTPIDPFAVIERGEHLVRRRRRFVAAGAALAVAVAVGATVLSVGSSQRVDPAPGRGIARPLTYGVGQVLRVGDSEIDTGVHFLSIDVTDDGAALTTFDGRIWFSDGTTMEPVGATLPLRAVGRGATSGVSMPAGRPRDWVVNDSSGSLLAWIEYRAGDRARPELVVYDTARRTVAARVPLEGSDEQGARVTRTVAAVAGREVFVSTTSRRNLTDPLLLRYSLDSGTSQLVGRDVLEAAVRAVPRAVVVGRSAALGEPALHLARAWDPHHLDRFDLGDPDGLMLFEAHTGRALDLRVPDPDATVLWPVQWIDDDRIAMISGLQHADLLTCRISTLECEVTVGRSAWDDDGPIIPGFGGDGADRAVVRAMRESRD